MAEQHEPVAVVVPRALLQQLVRVTAATTVLVPVAVLGLAQMTVLVLVVLPVLVLPVLVLV